MKKEEPKQDKLQVQQLRPPKFKDKKDRSRLVINLKHTFGFMPEILIIDKVPNVSNQIVISAVLPEQSQAVEKILSSKKEKKDARKKGSAKSTQKPRKESKS